MNQCSVWTEGTAALGSSAQGALRSQEQEWTCSLPHGTPQDSWATPAGELATQKGNIQQPKVATAASDMVLAATTVGSVRGEEKVVKALGRRKLGATQSLWALAHKGIGLWTFLKAPSSSWTEPLCFQSNKML